MDAQKGPKFPERPKKTKWLPFLSKQTNSWINGLKSRQRKNKASLIVGPSSSFFLYFKSKSRWRCPAQGGALLEEDPPANSHHHTRPQLHNHFLGLYRIFVWGICTLLMFSFFISSLTLFHFGHLSPQPEECRLGKITKPLVLQSLQCPDFYF